MKVKTTFFLIFLFIFKQIIAQEGNELQLTHIMSEKERAFAENYTRSFIETPPPSGIVRSIAEWEPMEGVLIAYTSGFGIPISLIKKMSEDVVVTTIVANASEENTVRNIYTSNGVVLANCNFIHQDPNSYWTRDYSPWYVATDDSEVALIDFPYNRPRPNDDNVPVVMATFLDVDLYGMNITHTGGNFMCDGYGSAVSTDLVWEENLDQTSTEIEEKMQNYMGIDNYHVTIDPMDDYIKHVDCWGKFLDVDKILVAQVPSNDYRYADYEFVANYFTSQNCSWGYPYEVIRVQQAHESQDAKNPYTNSLILNHRVFVPITGHALDDDALEVYQNAMPGYEIIGVNSSGWINSDALHCRTHGIADRQMLFIEHYPLHGNYVDQNSFSIDAKIVSYGGSDLLNDFPKLFYKTNEDVWQEVLMQNMGNNIYHADIQSIAGSNTVKYYLKAQNENNKTNSHPSMGEIDPHVFTYENSMAISESKIESEVRLYPNPSMDKFNIFINSDDANYTIFDTNGKMIFSGKLFKGNNIVQNNELQSGIYTVRIENKNLLKTLKLIVL